MRFHSLIIRDQPLRCGTALGSKNKSGSHEYPSSQVATLLAAGTMAISLLAASRHAATPDKQAVLVPINAMLGGMAVECRRFDRGNVSL